MGEDVVVVVGRRLWWREGGWERGGGDMRGVWKDGGGFEFDWMSRKGFAEGESGRRIQK